MTDVNVSQYDLDYLFTPDEASAVHVSQYSVEYIWNLPSEEVQVSQLDIDWVTEYASHPVNVSQLDIDYVYRGRVEDPHVRCFTFTLDGHDFYVVRLGMNETILYDTQTNHFYVWGSSNQLLWRAYDGCNWLDGYVQAVDYGSNIVIGDDGTGTIYFLDPDGDEDDDALQGSALQRPFIRRASGQVATKGYSRVRCYGIELLGSIGQLNHDVRPDVRLSYSDDRGASYVSAGDISLVPEQFEDRLFWRSLGSVKAPGRIFRITDWGALKRIDSITMIADGEGKP